MLALSGVTIVVAIFTLLPTQESLDGEIAAAADFFFPFFFLFSFSFFPWFNFENCLRSRIFVFFCQPSLFGLCTQVNFRRDGMEIDV